MIKKISLILLITLITVSSVFAADEPWYEGVKISQFETEGIVNASRDDVSNILFKYRNKVYSEDLFNQLQSDLYALNSFSYFYAEANRVSSDSNELKITLTFFEKQMLNKVTFDGNKELNDSTLLEDSGLVLNSFYEGYEMAQATEKIKSAYYEKGYSDVVVTPKLVEDDSDNTVALNFTIEENKQVVVGEIAFECNKQFNDKNLTTQLKSTTQSLFRSGYYSVDNANTDIQNLSNFYYDRGYIMAKVSGPTKEVIEEGKKQEKIKLVYTVDEGDIWNFGDFNFSGNTVFTTDELNQNISLKPGDVFNRGLWMKELQAISQLYYDKGYINLAITPQTDVDEENHVISFTININEGNRAKVNDIIINGIGTTQEVVYTRELTFKKGEYFNKSAIEQSLRNIQNTQLVTELNYSIEPIDADNCNIIINITEGGQQDIQFGVTFGGTTTGFPVSGFATITDRNLLGTGNDLSTNVTISPSTQKASLNFVDEYFNEVPWSNGFSLSVEHSDITNILAKGSDNFYTGHLEDNIEDNAYPLGYNSYLDYLAAGKATPDSQYLMDYDLYRISAGYDTGYTFKYDKGSLILSTGLNIGINKAVLNGNYLPFEELIYNYSKQWQFSNKLNLGIAWDGRDLIQNTTTGWYVAQNFTYAGGLLGGLSNYIKSSTSFSAFTPVLTWKDKENVTKKVVGSFSSNLSLMLPQYYSKDGSWGFYEAKEGATVNEMLYIDGASTALGHSMVQDQAFLFDNKLSLEYSIIDNILALDTFVSATAITPSLSNVPDFNSWDWYFAAGSGLKIKIPGFPIGLYLVKDATVLNSESEGFKFLEGPILNLDDNNGLNGLRLVLSFTTNLF